MSEDKRRIGEEVVRKRNAGLPVSTNEVSLGMSEGDRSSNRLAKSASPLFLRDVTPEARSQTLISRCGKERVDEPPLISLPSSRVMMRLHASMGPLTGP